MHASTGKVHAPPTGAPISGASRPSHHLGRRFVAGAARHLDSAGIPHKDRIELGELGEITLRCAREADCDLIVLAEPRRGAVRTWLIRALRLSVGSIASLVVHFARVPVVVVP